MLPSSESFLADHKSLRMVVLNCPGGPRGSGRDLFSSTAATLVRYGVPAVLAMQFEISDQMAIELYRTFYGALSEGLPVDAAVSEARKSGSLVQTRSAEWMSPVLFMRSPDGVLFRSQPQPTEPSTRYPDLKAIKSQGLNSLLTNKPAGQACWYRLHCGVTWR